MAKYKDRTALPEILKVLLAAAATFFVLLFVEAYVNSNGDQTTLSGISKDLNAVKATVVSHSGPGGAERKSSPPTATVRPQNLIIPRPTRQKPRLSPVL